MTLTNFDWTGANLRGLCGLNFAAGGSGPSNNKLQVLGFKQNCQISKFLTRFIEFWDPLSGFISKATSVIHSQYSVHSSSANSTSVSLFSSSLSCCTVLQAVSVTVWGTDSFSLTLSLRISGLDVPIARRASLSTFLSEILDYSRCAYRLWIFWLIS